MCASRIVPPQAHGWLPQFTPSPRMYASSSEIKNSQRLRRPFVTGWAGIFPARAIDKTVERAILRKAPASTGPIGHSLIWRSFSVGPAGLLTTGSLYCLPIAFTSSELDVPVCMQRVFGHLACLSQATCCNPIDKPGVNQTIIASINADLKVDDHSGQR